MRIPVVLAALMALAFAPVNAAAQDNEEYPAPVADPYDSYGADQGVNQPEQMGEDAEQPGVGGAVGIEEERDEDVVEQPMMEPQEVPAAPPYLEEEPIEEPGTGGTGAQMEPMPTEPMREPTLTPPPPPERETTVIVTQPPPEQPQADQRPPTRGLTVAALGGVEGYTGDLAPRIDPGPSWGVIVNAQPTNIFGIELGYSGAVNGIDDPLAGDADIVRNGGDVKVRVSLVPRTVEPYLFGGVGIARANVRDAPVDTGYVNDTFGSVPAGGGVNFHLGAFTAGVRASYNFLFDRDFTPETRTNSLGIDEKQSGDTWNGYLHLGATF